MQGGIAWNTRTAWSRYLEVWVLLLLPQALVALNQSLAGPPVKSPRGLQAN